MKTISRITALSVLAWTTHLPLAQAAGPIIIAWETAPRTVDSRYAVDADSQYLEDLIHCSLMTFDKEGKTVGDLADSYQWTNPTTLVVKLKKTAKFSNGMEVTGADVKATYDFFLKKEGLKNPSPRAGAFAKVLGVSLDAKKPLEVGFTLAEPDATFATNLVVGILPAALASNDGMTELTTAGFAGCGPFTLKTMDTSGLLLERNTHYALGAAPKAPSIEIKIVKDENTRYAKLEKGEVDIVQNLISRDKLEEITKANKKLKVLRRQGLNTTYLGFNMADPILGNVGVRQAIAAAINTGDIIKYIMKDYATPATGLLPSTDAYFSNALKRVSYDLRAAEKLLDEAGFKDPDGKGPKPRLTLSYKTTTNATRINIAKAIASSLKKVGIEVIVEPLEWGRFKDDVEKGKVQLWSLAWIGFKDPDIFRFAFGTESFPPNGGNRGRYSNPELDKLLSEGRTTTDAKKRKAIYDQVQTIVAKDLPYVFLWHEDIYAVTSNSVSGFEIYADGRYASLKKTSKN